METYRVCKGQKKTVYSHFNISGHLYLKITGANDSTTVKAWWIKGPFGSIKQIGHLQDSEKIKIQGTLFGKLRILAENEDVLIQVHDDSEIASNFPDIRF